MLVAGVERVAVLRGKAKRERDRAVAGITSGSIPRHLLKMSSASMRSSRERRYWSAGSQTVVARVRSPRTSIRLLSWMAAADPPPIPQLLDRPLVVAEANDIPPMIVINKIDLAPATELLAHIAGRAFSPLRPSAATDSNNFATLRGKESVFSGPSGAGKSSLMNAPRAGLGLRIGEVSAKLVRRGTHTTVSAVMIPLAIGGLYRRYSRLFGCGSLGHRSRASGRMFSGVSRGDRIMPV